MWFRNSYRKMIELFANSGESDQTPRSVASDMGLHHLPITHYENTPIQNLQKISRYSKYTENFQIKKKTDIFHISAQT